MSVSSSASRPRALVEPRQRRGSRFLVGSRPKRRNRSPLGVGNQAWSFPVYDVCKTKSNAGSSQPSIRDTSPKTPPSPPPITRSAATMVDDGREARLTLLSSPFILPISASAAPAPRPTRLARTVLFVISAGSWSQPTPSSFLVRFHRTLLAPEPVDPDRLPQRLAPVLARLSGGGGE